jgi:hypothetical protein
MAGWVQDDILLDFCVPQEFGPPFFVFLAGDLPGGISPLQQLQRRLHLPIGNPPHWHHEGKEYYPEKYPEKPPKPMHSPKIVHSQSPKVCGLLFPGWRR